MPKNNKASIYIVDDHPLWSVLLAEVINGTGKFMVLGTATEAATGLNFLNENEVDLLLLDLALPGTSGIEVLEALRKRKSKTKVVVLSGLGSNVAIAAAMVRGAHAYIVKTADLTEILNTLHEVISGQFTLNLRMSEVVREIVHKSVRVRMLSDQDLKIFRLLANHTPPKEIAEMLKVSASGIYKAQRRIYTHLGVTDTASLATIAGTFGMYPESAQSTFNEQPAKTDAREPTASTAIL